MVEVRLVGMYAGVVIGVAGESFGFFFVGKFARLYKAIGASFSMI